MLRFILFILLTALVLAKLELPSYLKDADFKVTGGDEAKPHSWPWQISLQFNNGSNFIPVCGGILIRPEWVLTAARCVDFPFVWRVVAGDHNIYKEEGTEQYLKVRKIYQHPNWNVSKSTDGYDIALLHLYTAASLNDYVKLGALSLSGQDLPDTTTCYVTGWGQTKVSGSWSDVLRQVKLPLMDYRTCSRDSSWGSIIKESMVCAGGDGIHAGCWGDNGGPLNCYVDDQWVVHGVTSFMFPVCNMEDFPTVFTKVVDYIDWINSIVH